MLKEIKKQAGGIILFIDELHTLAGPGEQMVLGRQCKAGIAVEASLHGNDTEYRHIRGERRFQKVLVDEPSEIRLRFCVG